jgi:excisionase family DNA binding protein
MEGASRQEGKEGNVTKITFRAVLLGGGAPLGSNELDSKQGNLTQRTLRTYTMVEVGMVIDLKKLKGKMFSTEEVAGITGMHQESVRRAIRENRLKASQPPGSRTYFIAGEDLIHYLKGRMPSEVDDAR